ncbi:Hypothetical predicted protein [Paramuricea clavata]|uniref:Uncharacterized protein n=1 Tax=Paramuricea clavata TaxID=317549 RepID=A0A7D9HUU1_PARCT|nr:Hypothetical predicted protein [Paramuricea clavata]
MEEGESSSRSVVSSEIGGFSFVTPEEKRAKRKKYLADRDATKIYLIEEQLFQRWRQLRDEAKIKTDKDFAAMLLEHYVNTHTKQILTSSDAETQTDHTEETAIFIDSPVLASTPLQISVEVESRASASVSKRRRLSLESHDPEGADETATGVN